MKLAIAIVLTACTYLVWAERCNKVSECTASTTMCASNLAHAHIRCVDHHCTCSMDKIPCLLSSDCVNGTCIDQDGDRRHFHCLDGYCTCVQVPGEH